MTDHLRDAAMRTCDRHALARSYHVPPALDVVGILLKPSTWISGGILALCVWALINYGGN